VRSAERQKESDHPLLKKKQEFDFVGKHRRLNVGILTRRYTNFHGSGEHNEDDEGREDRAALGPGRWLGNDGLP
jgi:hypothetical protein